MDLARTTIEMTRSLVLNRWSVGVLASLALYRGLWALQASVFRDFGANTWWR